MSTPSRPRVLVACLTVTASMWACGTASSSPESAIRAQVDAYITSINRADTTLGAAIWATTPDVTFIHPRGTEHGWEQVKQNFYENTMGARFSKRTLRVRGDVDIQVYGSTAVAVFEWDFVAQPTQGGQPINTKGRESQVFANTDGGGWRLVHVHYSGLPVTGEREGF